MAEIYTYEQHRFYLYENTVQRSPQPLTLEETQLSLCSQTPASSGQAQTGKSAQAGDVMNALRWTLSYWKRKWVSSVLVHC